MASPRTDALNRSRSRTISVVSALRRTGAMVVPYISLVDESTGLPTHLLPDSSPARTPPDPLPLPAPAPPPTR